MTNEEFLDRISEARAAKHSWADINTAVDRRRQAALDAGYNETEIRKAMGFNPGDIDARLHAQAVKNIEINTPKTIGAAAGAAIGPDISGLTSPERLADTEFTLTGGNIPEAPKAPVPPDVNPWEAFQKGFRNSVTGLVFNNSVDPTAIVSEHEGMAEHIAEAFGAALGDLPAMAVGGVAGGVAGSSVPAVGTTVGAMGGAFALPAWIRSQYAQALVYGEVTGPDDYIRRQLVAGWEATKGFAVGTVTAKAGMATKPYGAIPQFSAELTTMVAAGAAMEGQLPTLQDFIDGGVVLGAFKVGYAGARRSLIRHWELTGENPRSAVDRARRDEVFRQELLQDSLVRFVRDESGATQPPAPPPAPPPPKPQQPAQRPPGAPVDPVQKAAEDVASRFGKPGEGDPVPLSKETTAGTIYREVFSAEHPLTKALDAVRENRDIPATENPLLLMRAARNISEVAKFSVEDGQVAWNPKQGVYEPIPGRKGLEQIVKTFEGETGADTFWTYAQSKWAVQRAAQGFETGVDVPAAQLYVKARSAKYDAAFQELVEWQNQTLEALRGDILKSDVVDAIKTENTDYIPAQRIRPGAPSRSGSSGTGVQTFRGSEHRVRNTQELLLRRVFARYTMAAKNRARASAYDIAFELGQASEVKTTGTRRYQLTIKELEALEAEVLKDPTFDPESAAIWRTLKLEGELKPNEDIFFRDGELVRVEYEDVNLARFLKELDHAEQSKIGEIIAKFVRIPRASTTHMPDFSVRMAEWDTQWRTLVDPDMRSTVGTELLATLDGVLRIALGDKGVRDLFLSGGAAELMPKLTRDNYISNKLRYSQHDVSRAERAWNTVKRMNPLNLLFWWSNVWHRGAQYGKFRQQIKRGKTKLEAGQAGAEGAFPRVGGGGRWMQLWDKYIPFLNSHGQSVEIMTRAQFGIGRAQVSGRKMSPAKFTAMAYSLITVPTLVQWWLYKDEPWYQALSDFEKDNSNIIIPPQFDKDGNEITPTVPIMALPVASFFYGAIPRRVADAVWNHIKGTPQEALMLENMEKSFGWSFAPPQYALMYSLAAPIFGKIANYNFGTQTPLVPQWMKDGRLPPQQYTNYSSLTARKISEMMWNVPVVGKALGMNPPEIDMFISAWLGSGGTAAVRWSEQIARSQGIIDPGFASRPIWSLPGFTSWTAAYPSASAQPIQNWYSTMDEYKQIFGTMRVMIQQGDVKGFRELAMKNPTMTAMASFELQGANGLIALSGGKMPQFMSVMREIANKVDPQAAYKLAQVKRAFEITTEFARLVESVETPEIREAMEGIARGALGFDIGVEGPLTQDDKRQLLDRLYIGMMNTAQLGLRALDSAERKQ